MPSSDSARPRVEIVGSGVVGLTCALTFAERGCAVTLIAGSRGPDPSCCSWWAGGMLAPGCEMESAEPLIGVLGAESMAFWDRLEPKPVKNGTLVVAAARDTPDLKRFGRVTQGWETADAARIATLEPDLADRFATGLFFAGESHFDPREVLPALVERLKSHGVSFRFEETLSDSHLAAEPDADWRIDCRGLAARDKLPDLRGVKGEMLLLKTREITLSRPIRLLHPRIPLYIVPRSGGLFMVGATMIESDERNRPTVRSMLELLSAAYALHPAFGEAEMIEIGVDARPAFPDNLPRIRRDGRTIRINGMYRHGYLAAPAVARRAADYVLEGRVPDDIGTRGDYE